MTYTPLLLLTLAFVAATGFSLQDSPSADSLLSALSAMPDHAPVQEQPGYISALQREMEGLVDSPSVSRVSRRVRRKTADHLVCCGKGEKSSFLEKIKADYPDCLPEKMEGGGKDGKSFTLIQLCASVQCLAKKINVVDGDGFVLPTAFVDVLGNLYEEEPLNTLAKKLAPNCVTEANAKAKKTMDLRGNGTSCNMALLRAHSCVELGVIRECPEDLRVKDELCDKIVRGEIGFGI